MENWTIKCFCPVNSWIVINPLQHWVMRVPGGYFGPPLLHQGCFKSQKNNAIFASFARAVLFALWETGSSIFSLPVLPLSPPTHIWAIQHSAQTQTAHASHTGKTQPVLQHADPTQVTHCHMHTHTHIYTHARFAGGVTSCRDRTTNTSLSLCGFAEPECTALPSQADVPPPPSSHKYPPWVLYGPILFSPTQSQRCHGHVLLSL